jgi:hypothetical protein
LLGQSILQAYWHCFWALLPEPEAHRKLKDYRVVHMSPELAQQVQNLANAWLGKTLYNELK